MQRLLKISWEVTLRPPTQSHLLAPPLCHLGFVCIRCRPDVCARLPGLVQGLADYGMITNSISLSNMRLNLPVALVAPLAFELSSSPAASGAPSHRFAVGAPAG